jgi:hypothetical protein
LPPQGLQPRPSGRWHGGLPFWAASWRTCKTAENISTTTEDAIGLYLLYCGPDDQTDLGFADGAG